jgi:uncharacterized membrane protein
MTTYYTPSSAPASQPVAQSLITYTNIIYALHAFAVVMGVISTAATVVGGFVFSVPSIVAVIMNYAKRSQVQGTWLESHFSWQIRTFWFALLWGAVVAVISVPLMLIVVGFFTLYAGLLLLGIWIVYRVARGWLALNDRRPIQVQAPNPQT